jgi:hypothetical protein
MSPTIILHILNEDPVIAEMETLPEPSATCVTCTEVRKRDGKPVHYLTSETTVVIYPISRVTFIEVLGSEADRGEVMEFFRD